MHGTWKGAGKIQLFAVVIVCGLFIWLSRLYQGCIRFAFYMWVAVIGIFAGYLIYRKAKKRKKLFALGFSALVLLLDGAMLLSALPEKTYGEVQLELEEKWQTAYETVTLSEEGTKAGRSFYRSLGTLLSMTSAFYECISGEEKWDVFFYQTPYVYAFAADTDMILCIYDPFQEKNQYYIIEEYAKKDLFHTIVSEEHIFLEDE